MIIGKIDGMIKDSMKNHLPEKTKTYRLLKSALLLKKTEANAGPLDENAFISVIRKMVKQRKDSIESYESLGRQDLAEQEKVELEILQDLLPKEASKEDILRILNEAYPDLVIPKTDFGKAMGIVKKNLQNVDGKVASDIIKEYIG